MKTRSIASESNTTTSLPAPAAPTTPERAPLLPDDPLLREAYERVEPECGGLTPEQLAAINVDLDRAVGVVLQAEPRVRALRDPIARLPDFDVRHVDHLRDYALALWYADQLCQTGGEPVAQPLPELVEQTTRARDRLFLAAQPIVQDGLMPADGLASLRRSNAHGELANDVIRLVLLFRAAWPNLTGRTLVTVEQLDDADTLAHRLADAVQRRDYAPSTPSDALRNRQRVFTLFRRAYEQVRRALVYLRADTNDADEILPSIYNRGTHYTTAPKPGSDAANTAPTPPAPLAAPVTAAHVTAAHVTSEPFERPVPQDDPFGRT